jgi:HPr kinase/phosphorylase
MLHGSAVSIQGPDFGPSVVLLRGNSGRGKSDLAFRLIAAGSVLIGDDQVELTLRQDKVIVSAAENIKGLLEVRGVGLARFPVAMPAPLGLVIDLVPREEVPRLPEKETVDILGIAVTRLKLHAFDASAPFKIIKAIELVHKPDLLV